MNITAFLREARVLQDRNIGSGADRVYPLDAVGKGPGSRPLVHRSNGNRVELDLPDGDTLVWTGSQWQLASCV